MRTKTWIMLLHYPYQRKIKGRERPLVCITLPHLCVFLAIYNLEANKVHKKIPIVLCGSVTCVLIC